MSAFKDWLKTEDGTKCNDVWTLKGQPYLENRLYYAYNAGMISQIKTYQDTIEWYEQKKRESDKLIKELQATIESLKAERQPQQSV